MFKPICIYSRTLDVFRIKAFNGAKRSNPGREPARLFLLKAHIKQVYKIYENNQTETLLFHNLDFSIEKDS